MSRLKLLLILATVAVPTAALASDGLAALCCGGCC